MTTYDLWKFVMLLVISLVLNQTWIAIYMMVICAQPQIAHRICPMVSAAGGFAGGFIIPLPQMPIGWVLLYFRQHAEFKGALRCRNKKKYVFNLFPSYIAKCHQICN